jgi:hypothetical protein
MDLTAFTVAGALRSPDTCLDALGALEALPPPVPSQLALAAAPALADVVAGAAEEPDRAALDRAALLVARLLAEAALEPARGDDTGLTATVFRAAFSDGRMAAFTAPMLVAEAAQRASATGQPLTRADALSTACLCAYYTPAFARSATAPCAAAGLTVMEHYGVVSFLSPALGHRLSDFKCYSSTAHPSVPWLSCS